MPNYNEKAIEGHVYCWHLQRKPPSFSHSGLLKITNTELWTLEDIKAFYNKIDSGEYTLQGDDAIKGFIYCLYRQRMPFKTAHAKISKFLGQDEIRIEEVHEIYQKIEVGYNMEIISLEWILKLMNEKIINELDVKSRISVRNTSKALRTVIDNGNYKMELLKIKIKEKSITIEDCQDYRCSFLKKGSNCKIFDNGNYKLVKGAYWWRAEKGLKLLLGANKNMNIERLELEAPWSFEPPKFTIMDVLGSLNKKLKVKSLFFNVPYYDTTCYTDLLKFLDPHELKEMTTFCYRQGFFANQIFLTEHWKNLKSFTCDSEVHHYTNLGDTFGHLNFAQFRPFKFPTIDELVQLKDKLVQNRYLEAIRLSKRMEESQVNELRSHFDSIADFKTPFEVVPVTDRKIVSVSINLCDIFFKGPCSEFIVSGNTARLQGTALDFYETLEQEKKDDLKWYHFYY